MKSLSMMLFMVIASVCMSSCSDDDDTPTDFAEAVSGVYTGKLSVNNSVIEDAYIVTIRKISSTVVHVAAKFYIPSDEDKTDENANKYGENYNITYEGGQYLFKSESSQNINITVTGKSISISYMNNAGSMTTYIGMKD